MSKTFFSKRSDMFHYAASADYTGERVRSANSYVEGNDVYSYATKVAMFDKKKEILLYTGHHYSNTTSNSLYELRRAFDHFKKLQVYDFNVEDGWNRLVETLNEHRKHPATRKEEKQFFIGVVESFVSLTEFFGKGKKHLKTTTFECADKLAEEYKEQIRKKEQRWRELRDERIRKAEEERQRKIKATEDICREYDPEWGKEPETFRECLANYCIDIPVNWMMEHHSELLDVNSDDKGIGDLLFYRRWNTNTHQHCDYYSYKKRDYDWSYDKQYSGYKILRKISRYGGTLFLDKPDILVYDTENKRLFTNQNCEVDDTNGHVKKLLGLFLKAVDEGKDTSFVIGKHCGPYEIREWNASEKFLRVGCHCLLLENLREVYEDMKGE